MLALRLTRAAHLAVHLRRLLVAVASAGTGFLLLCALGHALTHPGTPGASALRLAWCTAPLAATAYLAAAVARTDPGTRPRPGLSAIGLGPGRLMAVSATTTALSAGLGSVAALLCFLQLRGDLTGTSIGGDVSDALAVGQALPVPAALTLLALAPATASAAVAMTLRPRERRPAAPSGSRRYGRFGAYGWGAARETFGTYGRFGARWAPATAAAGGGATAPAQPAAGHDTGVALLDAGGPPPGGDTPQAPVGGAHPPDAAEDHLTAAAGGPQPAPDARPAPRPQSTTALPWGIAVLTAGLAVETYVGNTTAPTADTTPSAGVLLGWVLTALGLALAGPGLTHLCGRLLQAVRPGALRLLAGRVLMEEAHRIGRPLGVVCAVASAGWAAATLYEADGPDFGPLSTLGALLVAGCTVATLLTAAVEAKHARADTTDALLRLGAPPATLRAAAAVRAGALLALFGPLTLIVARLASLPLTR
ncbi:hypothetical protein SAM40697_4878 [Streptomyces ambofaciens]|uniref:Integral membrane protein n=1 Tax=Streptomyces ambofaciens TaxID=1889 RepID=A0ABM6B4X9_STRAM|nr:hypothetical protein [Streptomyces ambofaciens]ANB08835.1 hypothetical protein SAM40697_4878 [Streptomyces ambofaciens]